MLSLLSVQIAEKALKLSCTVKIINIPCFRKT
ncbi:hypothetical protein G163CM_22310 [Pseudocitrobacter corydidari]|uniref:Uncharacterized protein n=1 Tax=Pseudocitrobacter corydidari TaxID=2891570 RepID=A0ABY3S765_9ENTR|nr:hypothetical protein G163CM_22310 [Pseudocitrobacter corydidari]